MDLFFTFFKIGFVHIVTGYDHLLFLLGLILVTKDLRSLLSVASAFTIAHSTTLVLSALGILSLPPIWTESLIALSIVYVAIENVVRAEPSSSRWVVAGAFGLIHGAGFSGHLTDILKGMMQMGNIWSPLMGFNVGIEVGQILVICIVLPLMWFVRKYGAERKIVQEVSRVIASVGGMLMLIRIFGLNP